MTLFETAIFASVAVLAVIFAYRAGLATGRRRSEPPSKTLAPRSEVPVAEPEPAPTPVPDPPPRPTVPPSIAEALVTTRPPPIDPELERPTARPPPVDVPLEAVPPPAPAPLLDPSPAIVPPPGPAPEPAPVERAAIEADDPERKKAGKLARLFVSEIKLYNEKAVAEGARAGDLYARLKEPIDQALVLFDRRVPQGVRAGCDYMYDEIVRQLAGGDATKIGDGYPRRRRG